MMHSIKEFWRDEAGSVVAAELVTVSAVVTIGAVTGMHAISTAVNHEFHDMTRALRSLDQSYSYRGMRGCHSMTAGSAFVDTSIDVVGNPPGGRQGGNQSPASTEMSGAFPDVTKGKFAEELDPQESTDSGPVTTADEKLGDE